mmetsp:Transcript_57777/g.161192  ORF Transcript_57777/g.161192 Transcript_57777/m.161192 type:complete len:220 (+) Transcript_57777:636-1295(+)
MLVALFTFAAFSALAARAPLLLLLHPPAVAALSRTPAAAVVPFFAAAFDHHLQRLFPVLHVFRWGHVLGRWGLAAILLKIIQLRHDDLDLRRRRDFARIAAPGLHHLASDALLDLLFDRLCVDVIARYAEIHRARLLGMGNGDRAMVVRLQCRHDRQKAQVGDCAVAQVQLPRQGVSRALLEPTREDPACLVVEGWAPEEPQTLHQHLVVAQRVENGLQ